MNSYSVVIVVPIRLLLTEASVYINGYWHFKYSFPDESFSVRVKAKVWVRVTVGVGVRVKLS